MADIIPFPEPDDEPVEIDLAITYFSPFKATWRLAGIDESNDHDMLNLAGLLVYLAEGIYLRYGGKEIYDEDDY